MRNPFSSLLRFPSLGLMVLLGLAQAGQAQSKAGATPQPSSAGKCPAGFRADSKTATDGWCDAIVHLETGIRMRLIPGGEFVMGAKPGDVLDMVPADRRAQWEGANQDEQPPHRVRVGSWYLAETEVTVRQWRQFATKTKYVTEAEQKGEQAGGFTPRFGDDKKFSYTRSAEANWQNPMPFFAKDGAYSLQDDHPVTMVTWNDASEFCKRMGMRLPTEAEWEYACRARTTTRFWWGDDVAQGKGKVNGADQSTDKYGISKIGDGAFPFADGCCFYSPCGALQANAFGLSDMLGNVAEWCADVYAEDAYGAAKEGEVMADPKGPAGAGDRVLRGGSWGRSAIFCRSASRLHLPANARVALLGFRPALSLP